MVPYGTSHKYGCQLKSLYCRAPFDSFRHFFLFRFFVVHIPTKTWELNSHHQQSPMQLEGIHTTGCWPVPRRDHLLHWYHHVSAIQPSALCLTHWLWCTRALFAVLGHHSLSATRTPRVGFWRVWRVKIFRYVYPMKDSDCALSPRWWQLEIIKSCECLNKKSAYFDKDEKKDRMYYYWSAICVSTLCKLC
jgi:hypothetical protein